MSIGFSVSDVINVAQLAWGVYRTCVDAPKDYGQIQNEVKGLEDQLRLVAELLKEDYEVLTPTRKERLKDIVGNCRDALNDTRALLEGYDSLGTKQVRVMDRFGFGLQNITQVRQNLSSSMLMLSTFQQHLSAHSHVQLHKKLRQLFREVRNGQRDGSTVSTLVATPEEQEQQWDQVCRDLEEMGISRDVADENKRFIVRTFIDAVRTGELDASEIEGFMELSPPAHAEDAPRRATEPDLRSLSILNLPLPPPAMARRATITPLEEEVYSDMSRATTVVGSDDDYRPPLRSSTSSPRRKSRINALAFKLISKKTRIIQAASDGDLAKVESLIKWGADVNARDRWGWTALSMAAYGGFPEIAKVLIRHGVEIETKDVDGDTPLQLALNRKHESVVKVIQDEQIRREKRREIEHALENLEPA